MRPRPNAWAQGRAAKRSVPWSPLLGDYFISRMMKFHFGFFFFIAAETSDSVGVFELT